MNVMIFLLGAVECLCAQTGPQFILSSKRVLGNGVRTHANYKWKIPSTGRPCGGSNPRCCIIQDSEPNTLWTELCQLQCTFWDHHHLPFPISMKNLKFCNNTNTGIVVTSVSISISVLHWCIVLKIHALVWKIVGRCSFFFFHVLS